MVTINNEPHSFAWHKQHNTEHYQATIGLKIADMLGLSQDADGRYYTAWGTKTPLGLYLTIKRVISENRPD